MPTAIADPQKNNAEVAQKLADQDISGQSTATGQFEDALSALDKLAAAVPEKKPDAPPVVEPDPAKAAADEAAKAEAELKAAEAAKAAEAERTAKLSQADQYFKDSPVLPSGASPKSAEAFAAVKIKAAQEISARESELTKLKAELSKLKESVGKPTPEQEAALKELEDHRTWRAKLDVDFDPKFKQFDKQVAESHEFIYAQLRKSSAVTDSTIEEIKKFGGPENVNLTKLFESIKDPTLQRLVEAKVADIEQVKWTKEQAIKSAKDNITGYLTEREKAFQASATAHTQATQQVLGELLGKLDWFAEKPAPADTAPETEKTAITEHNKFIGELKQQIAEAARDDSPQMRAVLITGMAQLFKLQQALPGLEAENASLKKQLAEVTEKWEKVKNGSVSRLRESQAPSNGQLPTKPQDIFTVRPGDALDAIAKQVADERAAKGR